MPRKATEWRSRPNRALAIAGAAALLGAGWPAASRGADAAGVAASQPPLDGADAVAAAVLVANPELEAIEARIAALEHAAARAGVWPDPMASIEDSNVPLDEPYPGAHPMSGLQLRLQQTFPFPGKTGARSAVARSRVDTARLGLAERGNRLSAMVRDLYHQLALVRQLRAVTERHVAAVGELVGSVRARYETGAAPQHDLLQLQVLRDRLTDELDEFGRRERELAAALLAALHLPPGTRVGTPDRTPLPADPPDLGPLVERAARSRPLLRELESQARTAALAADRAEAEKRPDLTFWLGYRYRRPSGPDAGEDLYSAGLAIPLPWFWNDRRWGEMARQEQAQGRALQSERAARLDEIRGRLDAALARWERASRKAAVYEGELVPGQRKTLAAALASYRVGRAEFATLYRAETDLLDLERAIHVARADAARAAVEVGALVGDFAPEMTTHPKNEER